MHRCVLLASPMEMPAWFALLYFCLWPDHLFGGLLSLRGAEGTEAAWFQGGALFALLVLSILVWRSRRSSRRMKFAILPVGYPVVIFLTNLAPSIFFSMIGAVRLFFLVLIGGAVWTGYCIGQRRAPAAQPRTTSREEAESCSFCHQPKSKVEKLIQGEDGVSLCNRCVALCYDVLHKEGVDMTSWRKSTPEDNK
jgi:hypothetical protein